MDTDFALADELADGQIRQDEVIQEDDALESEALIEEVSIDGMCGVY